MRENERFFAALQSEFFNKTRFALNHDYLGNSAMLPLGTLFDVNVKFVQQTKSGKRSVWLTRVTTKY